MTTTEKKWQPFQNDFLMVGDEVKLVAHLGRGCGGKLGIVERLLRKNILINVEGESFRTSPRCIAEWRRGNLDTLKSVLPETKPVTVKCDPAGLRDCKPGDAVLMWRGLFDVVQIIELTATGCKAKVIKDSGDGKVYRYKADQFVQKLGDWLS